MKLEQRLPSTFYEAPLFPLTTDEVSLISRHYTLFCEPAVKNINDQTWHDLDVNEIYVQMNNTLSSAGDYLLYAMLRQPCYEETAIKQRVALMNWAREQEEEREQVMKILARCGKRYKDDIKQPFLEIQTMKSTTYIPYLIWMLLAISLLMIPVIPSFLFCFLSVFVGSSFYYFYMHKKLEHCLDPLVYYVDHIHAVHCLANISFAQLPALHSEIKQLSEQLSVIRKKSSLGYFEDSAGLLNAITHQESRLYHRYASFLYEHQDIIIRAMKVIGSLDACIAASSYALRKEANQTIVWNKDEITICASSMIHPLVKDCVANDVDLAQNQMLTGSNATGKSTYLKMIALNALLAQSFGIVFANTYHSCFFYISTSMSIHDRLEAGESTFVAEGKSLKYLLDAGSAELPSLCVIDEILRGTNTLDRISASAVILKEFTKRPCRCVIATHDIELTQLLHHEYRCAHFSEKMTKGKMMFDYHLHEGVTKTRNAIDLLQIFTYDTVLVQDARNRLNEFERTGIWGILE